jgi:hypothetical protein
VTAGVAADAGIATDVGAAAEAGPPGVEALAPRAAPQLSQNWLAGWVGALQCGHREVKPTDAAPMTAVASGTA